MNIQTDKPYHIFAEVIEQKALEQFESAMQQSFVVCGALMPDTHTGYSLPIGAVIATKDIVVPAWVGYDIGCGMCALPTTYREEDVRKNAQEIFKEIYKKIPVGFSHNARDTVWEAYKKIKISDKLCEIFNKNGLKQLGSLGSGNHFIEIGSDENQKVWIVIHSGSRGVGHATATHYMRIASGSDKAREGHFGLYVDEQIGKEYITDMTFCLRFALENRYVMACRVVNILDSFISGSVDWGELINRNHNHVELKNGLWVHRKGATHAEKGMMGVIPGNMRDGSFIVCGKGDPNALWSSSHGVGRVLGRKEAKLTLKIQSFKETMVDIVATVTDETLDESPFAYKNIFEVMEQQKSMVDIVAHVKPIINIKG